ncbi:hypothetical protein GSI_11351 [Ganoderma sinense ZZ0214-1]|uniref:Uncharacterized protein n=1 Tax=Ganoderma sinense ZZ0214-1 TaxID=1077348 RepID=A0A2G8RVR9_9APHY|nr:hypothetical protein GSI_11351 [Ganoderma sinense ZZ0214-1]
MFTLLTLTCFCILSTSTRQGRTVRLLLALTLFALWASTTAFLVLNTFLSQYLILKDAYITWADSSSSNASASFDYDEVSRYLQAGACGRGTATLTINILLGDAIVWWRACVLWRGNWPIRVLCVLLLLATSRFFTPTTGVVDTCWACYRGGSWNPDPNAQGIGYLYEGFSFGVAATALSLATNVLATTLMRGLGLGRSDSDWRDDSDRRYRSFLKKYVEIGTRVSRLEKIMVLLVESGIAYCVLWIVIAILLAGLNDQHVYDSHGVLQLTSFWNICAVFVQGGLVPLIAVPVVSGESAYTDMAIYPTIIIVVVTLDRSQVEQQFWTADARSRGTAVETVIAMDDGVGIETADYRVLPIARRSREELLSAEKAYSQHDRRGM